MVISRANIEEKAKEALWRAELEAKVKKEEEERRNNNKQRS